MSNKENRNYKGNSINYKTNKFKSIIQRGYCTNSSSNSISVSERLQRILNELGLNYIYVYENLNQKFLFLKTNIN